MIELKDGVDFKSFMVELLPKSFFKRREGESNIDFIQRTAIKDSGWLEKAKERQRNDYWSEVSHNFCFSVLTFLRQNKIKKEQMEFDINLDLDLSGSYDYKMSEIQKIKNYMKNKPYEN